jgi:hypothetical protein
LNLHFACSSDGRHRTSRNEPMKKSIIRAFSCAQNSLAKRFCWREHLEEATAELARMRRELPGDIEHCLSARGFTVYGFTTG